MSLGTFSREVLLFCWFRDLLVQTTTASKLHKLLLCVYFGEDLVSLKELSNASLLFGYKSEQKHHWQIVSIIIPNSYESLCTISEASLHWGSFYFFKFLNFILFTFLYSRFLLVINFIHISVYMSIPLAQFITPPSPAPCGFPPLVSIRFFSTSVSQLLPCKPVHLYHIFRFHIHALIYNIYFSLSDLLHSVWQSLDPSTSQQITQFRSFLWLSNIPLYICTTSSLSIRLSMGI